MEKGFEGTLLSEAEIATCKAAPDYQPASVLLNKIKAEKEKLDGMNTDQPNATAWQPINSK